MTRRPDAAAKDVPHPLPQSGGSFTVMAGQLVLEEYFSDPVRNSDSAPEKAAVKPASKEA